MSLNSSEKDSDHLSKLQEQNGEEYEEQKKLEIAEKEKASRPKELYKGNRKKRLRRLRKMEMTKKIE